MMVDAKDKHLLCLRVIEGVRHEYYYNFIFCCYIIVSRLHHPPVQWQFISPLNEEKYGANEGADRKQTEMEFGLFVARN